jgi:hypothetical protein
MTNTDYELAENIWQELRQGRSRRPPLTVHDVQDLARKSAPPAGYQPSRTEADNARAQAWLEINRLGFSMVPKRAKNFDDQWRIAIDATAKWMKAAE